MSLRSILRKGFKIARKLDPLTSKIMDATKNLPGGSGAFRAAVESDAQSSNPFSADRSFWDIWAGGDRLSQDPDARALGRTVGSIFAGWYGAGAVGAGAGAQTTTAALAGQQALQQEGLNAQERTARELAAEEEAMQRELIAELRGEETTPIPLADEEAMRRQRRRSLSSIQRRRGRQSTILTGGGTGDRLGA